VGIPLNNTKTVILLFLCCCSCTSKVPVKKDRPFIYLIGSSKFFLLPAEDIENPIDNAQYISAYWQDKAFFFLVSVKADKAGMEMALVNEMGAPMGELSYRNGLVSFSSPIFPKSLKPEYIVADFQLCFYSAPALRQALEGYGLSFENTENSRRILRGETPIIEIEKDKNTVRLVNHLRKYSYTMEGIFE